MVTFAPGLICDEWELVLPDFRVRFFEDRPNWERGRLEHVYEHLRPGSLVYDCGAEHGDFTTLYRSWGANVVPIEPSAPYWPCIRSTWNVNGFPAPGATFNGFVADVTVRIPGDLNDFGNATNGKGWPDCAWGEIVPDFGFRHLVQDTATSRITIDDLASQAEVPGAPDALMIDTEGSEWHVLSGAKGVLEDGSLQVWVSVHEPTLAAWYSRTLDQIDALMASVGYAGTLLPAHGEAEAFWYYERSGR